MPRLTASLCAIVFLGSGVARSDNANMEQIATGGVRLLQVVTNTATGFPHNQATAVEFDTPPPQTFADAHFVPAQLGIAISAEVLAHALAKHSPSFSAGPDDAILFARLSLWAAKLDSEILDVPGRTHVDVATGKRALYQRYIVDGSLPVPQSEFDSIVSLLDNVQLIAGLAVAEAYLRRLAPSPLSGGLTSGDLLAVADAYALLLAEFDVGMWFDGYTLRLGDSSGPVGSGLDRHLVAKLDRIAHEGRLAPIVGLALGHLTAAEFDSVIDTMFSASEALVTPSGVVENLPYFGTALESFAASPFASREMRTVFGRDTLAPLAQENIRLGTAGNATAAGATGIATGFPGAFATFGLGPSEGTATHLDVDVLVFPAAMMMAGAVGSEAAISNLDAALAAGVGVAHPTFGLPNYLDFETGLVNDAVRVWGTLEVGQGTVALLNRLLGGDFLGQLLSEDPSWAAALSRSREALNLRRVVEQVESGEGDFQLRSRENASRERTAYLINDGDDATLDIAIHEAAEYELSVRYSNLDPDEGDEVELWIGGALVGSFSAVDTGDWNEFLESPAIPLGLLAAAVHEVKLVLTHSSGTGIELDRIRLLPEPSRTVLMLAGALALTRLRTRARGRPRLFLHPRC